MSPDLRIAFLLAAGCFAGTLGSAGAITSLVSYPALLAAGVPALPANIVNIVAGTALWPGSALSSRPELAGRGSWLRGHIPIAAAGAAIGVGLLLSTSANSFDQIVPFLVAAGALTLLLSPRLTPSHRGARQPHRLWLDLTILLVSVYAGYFGAGSGVMTLAALLITVEADIPVANALKNMLLGAGSLIASLALILLHHIDWAATVPLAIGMLAGSALGPAVTRRLPAAVLRPTVAVFGLALAIQLALTHGK
jgi:uncharacterized membrane protein YfcA